MERIKDYVQGERITILAKPGAPKTRFLGYDEQRDALKIALAAPPEDGKANKELLKQLKKTIGPCELIAGSNSKKKVVRIIRED